VRRRLDARVKRPTVAARRPGAAQHLALACVEGVDRSWLNWRPSSTTWDGRKPGPRVEHGARSEALITPLLAEATAGKGRNERRYGFAVRWHNSGRTDTRLLCILRDADMLDGLGRSASCVLL